MANGWMKNTYVVVSRMNVVIPSDVAKNENLDYNMMLSLCKLSPVAVDGWCGLFTESDMLFGWSNATYCDFESKWNWLVLQACLSRSCRLQSATSQYLRDIGIEAKIPWRKVGENGNMFDKFIDGDMVLDKMRMIGIGEFLCNEKCCVMRFTEYKKPWSGC